MLIIQEKTVKRFLVPRRLVWCEEPQLNSIIKTADPCNSAGNNFCNQIPADACLLKGLGGLISQPCN
ncbi:hypothetical protein AVDCRST_MAG92-2262 [uncultured Coleofasciculus sp.]|uniref:Uncharacterized protein n=1 Tax=uncultured Coleofasciculus sp. TaxID=1267456 RepID=A0A6J4IPT3_9CYAN|nr:hypothetical protein AVDCRST_MAG92-2262 [uncultured Coleofasciculus sp.]